MKKCRTKKATTIKILCRLLAAVVFLASIPAVSAIPYRNSFEQMDIINQQTKELNLALLARIQIMIDQSNFNMASYIPTSNLPESDNGSNVIKQILKQTLKTLAETEDSATSAGIRKIENMNASLSASVNNNGHSVAFRIKALETTAEINYQGFVMATLAYDVQDSISSLELSKSIGAQTYAYTHLNNADGNSDIIGVRWSF